MPEYGGQVQQFFPECSWRICVTEGPEPEVWSAHASELRFRLCNSADVTVLEFAGDFRRLQSSTVLDLARTMTLARHLKFDDDYKLRRATVQREIMLAQRAHDEAVEAGTPEDMRIAEDIANMLPALHHALETCTDA